MTDPYIKKLYHVCITVPDIGKALDSYQEVLGLQSLGSLRDKKPTVASSDFQGKTS